MSESWIIHACRRALANAGLSKDDIDLWEIDEPFAVVSEKFQRDRDLDRDKVNVNGAAIVLSTATKSGRSSPRRSPTAWLRPSGQAHDLRAGTRQQGQRYRLVWSGRTTSQT